MTARRPGRPPKYPWAQWLDGKDKLLTPGRNFDQYARPESIRRAITQQASRKGILIQTRVDRYSGAIELRFPAVADFDWDELFDGEPHWLVQTEDFIEPIPLIQEQILGMALRMGLQVRVVVHPELPKVGVRSLGPIEPEGATIDPASDPGGAPDPGGQS